MKKLLFIPVLALMGVLTSCDPLEVSGNEASSQCYYVGIAEGYEFTDSANVDYKNYITDALAQDSIVNTIKMQSSKVNVSSLQYAILICDQYADDYYSSLLRREFRLDDVKRRIFSASYSNDTTFSKLISGYDKFSELPLKEFKVALAYYNYSQSYVIRRDTIVVK